jgi:hypothetical protein
MGCCNLQQPAADGAPFVFGIYNAGHIWPSQGNEWLKEFALHALQAPADAERPASH